MATYDRLPTSPTSPLPSPLGRARARRLGPRTALVLVLAAGLLIVLALQFHISPPSDWTVPFFGSAAGAAAAAAARQALVTVPDTEDIKLLHEPYKWYSDAKLRWLTTCLVRGDCPANADNVVIFSTFHCFWAVYTGYHGGEGIWCLGMIVLGHRKHAHTSLTSQIEALEAQGYTVLHAGENDWEYVYHIHRQIPDMVRVIVSEEGDVNRHGTSDMYLKSKTRPDGIPAWKYFHQSYYPAGWATVVGNQWVVAAEPKQSDQFDVTIDPDTNIAWATTGQEDLVIHDTPDSTYLGYAVDPQVSKTHIVPWEDRPNRVWILGKWARFFHDGDTRVYDMDFFARAHAELSPEFPGFEFVASITEDRSDEDQTKWGDIPAIIRNLPKLNRTEFEYEFGQAKLMLGMGSPTFSPSPYQALAKAVPFVNPHHLKEGGSNDNPDTWSFSQHPSLNRVPEPYAYQLQGLDYKAFVSTIRKALTTPTGQFRFERMRDDVVQRRMSQFTMADWRGRAAAILEARKSGEGGGALFEL